MSKRHRGDELAALSKVELRAHAHAERHRIKGELPAIATRVGRSCEPDECDEPAIGWKPVHHHDDHHAKERSTHHGRLRHWKMKEWKRRSTTRRQRAQQEQLRARMP